MKLLLKETIRANGQRHLPKSIVDTLEIGISDAEADVLVRRGTATVVIEEEAPETDEQRQAREAAEADEQRQAREAAEAEAAAEPETITPTTVAVDGDAVAEPAPAPAAKKSKAK